MGRAAEDQAKVKEDSSGKFSGSGNGKVIESTMTVVVEDKKSRALLAVESGRGHALFHAFFVIFLLYGHTRKFHIDSF